jgi:cytochrome c556
MTRAWLACAALPLALWGCARSNEAAATEVPPDGSVPSGPATALAAAVTEPGPRAELVREQPLSPLARRALRRMMVRHGEDMESLLWATLMLDFDTASVLASDMAAEPRIARPRPEDSDTLNVAFPGAFFDYQDQLARRQQALAEAARGRDEAALGRTFGALAETCVGCHALYVRMPITDAP